MKNYILIGLQVVLTLACYDPHQSYCESELSEEFLDCIKGCDDDQDCVRDCSRSYNSNLNNCPCYSGCPSGCPCPDYRKVEN